MGDDARQRGYTLIEMLVALVVVAILVGLVVSYLGRGGGGAKSAGPVATPVGQAKSVACGSNLTQAAMALQQVSIMGDRPQAIREALQHGATEEMLHCPASKQPYRFDPTSGIVSCPTPGHEGLAGRVPVSP
jgi:prepilin-type N-terminal cleavage/methylation domain-containing protein